MAQSGLEFSKLTRYCLQKGWSEAGGSEGRRGKRGNLRPFKKKLLELKEK